MRSVLVCLILSIFGTPLVATEHFFDVTLLPSIADRNMDFWFYVPPGSGPEIPVVKKVYHDQVFMLLMPCRVHPIESQTLLDIEYDLKLIDPDGKVALEENNISYYHGPVLDGIILSEDSVAEFFFEEPDRFGTYTIHVHFHEKVSQRHYQTSVKIELVEFKMPENFNSLDAFGDWIMGYYRYPEPIHSLSGILEFVSTEESWVKENSSLLTFFRRVLIDNPFLWQYYKKLYNDCSVENKKKMLLVAAMVPMEQDKEVFFEAVENEMKLFYEKVSDYKIPDTANRITTAEQLDMLWAEFFASGTYLPIKQIVSALGFEKSEDLMLRVASQAAKWSLSSNCLRSHRVHQYCQTIYEIERLDPGVKDALNAVLKTVEMEKNERESRRKGK